MEATAEKEQRIVREKVIPKFRRFLEDNEDKRVLLLAGGKHSGKSIFARQRTLRDLYELQDVHNVMVRATGPDLTDSMFEPCIEMLDRWGTPYKANRSSAHQRIYVNGSQLMFKSMQKQQTRHRHFASVNVNDVVIEEAPELTWEEFNELDLQARRPNPNRPNRIMLLCNTDNPYSWVRTVIAEGDRSDVAVLYTTIYDNPFASDAQIQLLENLKFQNKSLYRAYLKGEWAAPEGQVYSNYEISAKDWPEKFDDEIISQDVGTVNPMATCHIGFLDERPWEAWITLLLYQTGMTDQDLAEWYTKDMRTRQEIEGEQPERPRISRKLRVYCDTDPGTIKTLERAGYVVIPADKKSVEARIRFVRQFFLHIYPGNEDIKREIRGYVCQQDRYGNYLEVPVKMNDHAMNSFEYGIYTHKNTAAPKVYAFKMSKRRAREKAFAHSR